MHDRIESALNGFVAGDAIGSLFDGMSRGHVKSNFPVLKGYPDISDALKNRMELWKKPGLYFSISQMGIIFGILNNSKSCDASGIMEYVSEKGKVLEGETGIYRMPPRGVSFILRRCFENTQGGYLGEYGSIIPVLVMPVIFSAVSSSVTPLQVMTYAKKLGAEAVTSVGCALLVEIIKAGVFTEEGDPLSFAESCAEDLSMWIDKNQPGFFDEGFNPDKVREISDSYQTLFKRISGKSLSECEREIIEHAHSFIKHPISRGTVDHPMVIFPFACAIAASEPDKMNCLYRAASMGGSSGVLASITGLIAGAFFGKIVPLELEEGMINKKSIKELLHRISMGSVSKKDADVFFESEIPLSRKESDERRSKCGNDDNNERKKPKIDSKENILSRHVVESWTKIDKARYNRERRHNQAEINYEDIELD